MPNRFYFRKKKKQNSCFEVSTFQFSRRKYCTDVKINPFDWLFSTSVKAFEISCSNGVFNALTGGRFNSSVAIPVELSTVKLTNLNCCAALVADEKYRHVVSDRKHCCTVEKFFAIILNKW